MKRATVTLPDDLSRLLETYRRTQEVPPAFTSVVQAALREYLAKRGLPSGQSFRPFEITPATEDSGASDVSMNHDRYLAESSDS
jgi:hypothetical protein